MIFQQTQNKIMHHFQLPLVNFQRIIQLCAVQYTQLVDDQVVNSFCGDQFWSLDVKKREWNQNMT